MSCRSRRVPPDKPQLAASYLIVVAALVVILLPTILNFWLGHAPVVNLSP
jgi:hypothetical protein